MSLLSSLKRGSQYVYPILCRGGQWEDDEGDSRSPHCIMGRGGCVLFHYSISHLELCMCVCVLHHSPLLKKRYMHAHRNCMQIPSWCQSPRYYTALREVANEVILRSLI